MIPINSNIATYNFQIKVLVDNVLMNDDLQFTLIIKHECEEPTVTPPPTVVDQTCYADI